MDEETSCLPIHLGNIVTRTFIYPDVDKNHRLVHYNFRSTLQTLFYDFIYISNNSRFDFTLNIKLVKKIINQNSTDDVKITSLPDKQFNFAHPRFQGKINLTGKTGYIDLIPDKYAINTLYRTLYSLLLPKYNGILLHSAGVKVKNIGILFSGPTGTGKTTIIKHLISRYDILNDEINLLRFFKGKVLVYPTPFGVYRFKKNNQFQSVFTEGIPLSGIFFLSPHRFLTNPELKVSIRPELKKANIYEKLLPNRVIPNLLRNTLCFTKDKFMVDKLINLVSNISNRVNCYQI